MKDTLTEVRCKYWFARGRQFVRKIVYRCVRCCKLKGLHYRAVLAPTLPEFRVQEATPFAYCGVDFAGPLYITVTEGSIFLQITEQPQNLFGKYPVCDNRRSLEYLQLPVTV